MNQNKQQQQMIDKMGYDRSITMFSPDGRLLQVEYAKKTVQRGSTAIGLACKNGVVFVTDKRVTSKLMVAEAIEKMFRIDDHIGAAAAGVIADARVLVDRVQLRAQQHSVTYDGKIDILSVVKEICDLKQIGTQSGGLRPFGVSLLVGGVDEDGEVKLFQYRAAVVGEGEAEIEAMLNKRYKSTMSVDEGLKFGLSLMKEFLKDEYNVERVDAAYIDDKTRRFTKLSNDELRKLMK